MGDPQSSPVSMVISRSRKRVAISRKEAMVAMVEVKDMGVSINGSPKWLVYNGKSY